VPRVIYYHEFGPWPGSPELPRVADENLKVEPTAHKDSRNVDQPTDIAGRSSLGIINSKLTPANPVCREREKLRTFGYRDLGALVAMNSAFTVISADSTL
jgi:hypothetical protein